MIQEAAGTDWKEMYQVFNMGQRLEIYTDTETAKSIIEIASTFNIEACISGYVADSMVKEVVIESNTGSFIYQ